MTYDQKIKERKLLKNTYKNFSETENGKTIIKDLEKYILRSGQYCSKDIATDSLLREGGRILLDYILSQSEAE